MGIISRFLLAIGICFIFQNKELVAQDRHAILIIADHHQPFYLRTASKVYSSNSHGYLIIGGLSTGEYAFTLGFPKNKWTAIKYKIQIEQDDLYLLLKKIDSTTWGLYNKKGMQLFLAEEGNALQKVDNHQVNDVFSKTLAEVSDNANLILYKAEDSASLGSSQIKQLSKSQSGEGKAIEISKTAHIEPGKDMNALGVNSNKKDSSVSNQKENIERLKIKRTMYKLDSNGVSMNFELKDKDSTEQIGIFIPSEKSNNSIKTVSALDTLLEAKNKDKSNTENSRNDVERVPSKTESVRGKACDTISMVQDFKSLRREMTLMDDEEKMIALADSLMSERRKCYPVDQIKNLGLLFLQDSLRLKFIEKALLYVASGEDLNVLETLFSGEEQLVAVKKLIEQKR
jgi:hypothetical protein